MAASMAALDPFNDSLYRRHRGVGPLATEHVAVCGHAAPTISVGDAIPETSRAVVAPAERWAIGDHWLSCSDSIGGTGALDLIAAAGGINRVGALVWDPPFEAEPGPPWWRLPSTPTFVFTNNTHVGETIRKWGAPRNVLVWDTAGVDVEHMRHPLRDEPLRAMKLCLVYGDVTYRPNGDTWDRAVRHGEGRHGRAELADTFRLPLGSLPRPDLYQKPVDWVRRIIGTLSTGPILDPFGGTGTTFVTACQLDRPCLAVELDPAIADIALARIAAWSGEAPVRVAGDAAAITTERRAERKRERNRNHTRNRTLLRLGIKPGSVRDGQVFAGLDEEGEG